MARRRWLAAAATVAHLAWAPTAVAAGQSLASAAAPASDHVGGARLLDVPFLPQTEDLCGGAALAMTLRYWGQREVYPDDFASLVDRSASGIRTDVLADAARRRGVQAFPIAAAAGSGDAWVRQHIDQGRPVIALLEVRPGRYHYVVIVGWTGAQVIAHDPARAPFQVMPVAEFDQAWAAAGRWALLVLPRDGRPSSPPVTSRLGPAPGGSSDTDACGALVGEMVTLARAGDLAGADRGLTAATEMCPRSPAAFRELAGVRFLQSRWTDASAFAERSARLDPDDAQAWNLLATSRFLGDEPAAALEAWNAIGRPSVDLVRVEGVRRTRHPVIAALIDLPPRSLLTADALGRAARRLDALPSAAATRLRYTPIDGGLAEVEAVVVERPTVPRGVLPVVAVAARTLLRRESSLDVSAPTGSGELLSVAWRWWEQRPRVGVRLAVPGAFRLPGVTTIAGSWERPSYATPSAAPGVPIRIQRDERRRAAVSVADWATSRVGWQAGLAFDRWSSGSHLAIDVALDLRVAADRLSIGLDGAAWAPVSRGGRFATAGLVSAWRSSLDHGTPSWTVVAGLAATSAGAPFDLWPGAGTGHGRAPLLRAHPLLDRGIVSGPVFGRRLGHVTVEYQYPLVAATWGALRLAGFADTARAWRRTGGDGRSSMHADVGAGVRLVLPGSAGTMRADVARGLRDGHMVVSTGWQVPWPGR